MISPFLSIQSPPPRLLGFLLLLLGSLSVSAGEWSYDHAHFEDLDPIFHLGVLSATDEIPHGPLDRFGVVELPWKLARTQAKGFWIFEVRPPSRFAPRETHLVLETNGPTRVLLGGSVVAEESGAGFHRIRIPLSDIDSAQCVVEVSHGDAAARLQSARLEAHLPGLEELAGSAQQIFRMFNQYGPTLDKFHFREGTGEEEEVPPFDLEGKTEAAAGHRWESDGTVGWYFVEAMVPETIAGRKVSDSELRLSVSADRRSRLFIGGVEIPGRMTDGHPTLYILPDRWKPGMEVPIILRVDNFAGRGGLRTAEWRLGEIDALVGRVRSLERSVDETIRILRGHDRPRTEWVTGLAAVLDPLRDASSDLSRLTVSLESAGDRLDLLRSEMDAIPTFTLNPYLQDARSDRVTVMWETSAPVLSKVRYGREHLNHEAAEASSATRVHAVTIDRLEPDSLYRYQVVSGDRESGIFSFRTAPVEDRPFSFLLWGDNQSGVEMAEKVFSRMAEEPSDFVVNVGDLVDTGARWHEWREQCFTPVRHWAHSRPFYVAIGNHCQKGFWVNGKLGRIPPFETYFRMPDEAPGASPYFYSFKYCNARFVFIDPLRFEEVEDPKAREGVFVPEDDPHLVWLREELARHDPKEWLFAFMHEPPYAEGWAGSYYDGEAQLRQSVVPVLERYGVDVVFSGHMHGYERGLPHPPYDQATGLGNTIAYVISGGGGGTLDDHKYKEWPAMDLPDHPADPTSHEPDAGEYYRHHFLKVEVSGDAFELKAIEVLPDGRRGTVFDSFRLRKNYEGAVEVGD